MRQSTVDVVTQMFVSALKALRATVVRVRSAEVRKGLADDRHGGSAAERRAAKRAARAAVRETAEGAARHRDQKPPSQ